MALGEELEGYIKPQGEKDATETEDMKPPQGLDRLEMLATVRERADDVVRVFGDAMDWSLEEPLASTNSVVDGDDDEEDSHDIISALAGETLKKKKKRRRNINEKVAYLLASGDIDGAQRNVDELRLLASVFDGTIEAPARYAVVEALEKNVAAAREKAGKGKVSENGAGVNKAKLVVDGASSKRATEEKKEEGGYYGLIEQLTGLRGMG